MNKKVYIEYRDGTTLTDAYSVELGSDPDKGDVYGIKRLDGTIVVDDGESVSHPSTGLYEYTYDFDANTIYRVSWKIKITASSQYRYLVEEVGPFDEDSSIRAVAEKRGTFRIGEDVVVMLEITDLFGQPRDAESISIEFINVASSESVETGTPDHADSGFYGYTFETSEAETDPGEYLVVWTYTVDGTTRTCSQTIIISDISAVEQTLYSGRILAMRFGLTTMLNESMRIPVEREAARPTRDFRTYHFTFPRWNQGAGCEIYLNDEIVESGITVNYFTGTVTFDQTLLPEDRVEARYNFRWFSDEELDRFVANATYMVNIFPPRTFYVVTSMDLTWTPVVLYGAIIDALRSMMLSLSFQQPQIVFGGPDGAKQLFGNLESLKKNYEEMWKLLLEQKKLGPYKGLTRFTITPEFALPGGRSRWFRYLFSGGS